MHDAGVRRDGLEALEGGLAPAQERVALLVALELLLRVDAEGVARAEDVDLHGVVDDELDRHERVDLGRVAAEVGHRVAHRGEVDHAGHAREVLQHHARGRERDLLRRLARCGPTRRAPRCRRRGRRPRPRCGAGSRAGPSGRTAGGRRRTSTAARRAGRSRTCGRRPRALRVRQRSCQPYLHITPGPAATPPRSRPPSGSPSFACQATVKGICSPGLQERDPARAHELGVRHLRPGPRPGDQRLLPNVFRNTGDGR